MKISGWRCLDKMLANHVEQIVFPRIMEERPRRRDLKGRSDFNRTIVMNRQLRSIDFLNPTASMVYELCDGTNTIKDIVDHLNKKYPDVDCRQITYDVIKCVRRLEARQILVNRICTIDQESA